MNTNTKLVATMLCALELMSINSTDAMNNSYESDLSYYLVHKTRSPERQAQGIMTMFGGLVVKSGKLSNKEIKNEAFQHVYDAMCVYFRLHPENFNVGKYGDSDKTYLDYSNELDIEDFKNKINAMENFFHINSNTSRDNWSRAGEQNIPLFFGGYDHQYIYAASSYIGASIVDILGIEKRTDNHVENINCAGNLDIADTKAKKDALMFYRCVRSSMSLNNFGYSMIRPEGKQFIEFVLNTIKENQ